MKKCKEAGKQSVKSMIVLINLVLGQQVSGTTGEMVGVYGPSLNSK